MNCLSGLTLLQQSNASCRGTYGHFLVWFLQSLSMAIRNTRWPSPKTSRLKARSTLAFGVRGLRFQRKHGRGGAAKAKQRRTEYHEEQVALFSQCFAFFPRIEAYPQFDARTGCPPVTISKYTSLWSTLWRSFWAVSLISKGGICQSHEAYAWVTHSTL